MNAHIAVLITCHNRKLHTLECLRALEAAGDAGTSLSVFLLDDASSDGTANAVRAAFPHVHLIQGTGNLYWAGGMSLAWSTAAKVDPDYFLLLNDDTVIREDAIKVLLRTFSDVSLTQSAIVVGSTASPITGDWTYGGYRLLHGWEPVIPCSYPQRCDAANGNILLVPRTVRTVLPNLDSRFTHGMADFDYTLRCNQMGFPVYVAPGYLGNCSTNPPEQWNNSALPLLTRWRALHSPKGLPPSEYATFARRHLGPLWPFYVSGVYLRVIFPDIWNRQGRLRSFARVILRRTAPTCFAPPNTPSRAFSPQQAKSGGSMYQPLLQCRSYSVRTVATRTIKRHLLTSVLHLGVPLGLSLKPSRRPVVNVCESRVKADGRALFVFTFDDLSPAPSSVAGRDTGSQVGTGVAANIESLLSDFPFLRPTIFVIPDFRPQAGAMKIVGPGPHCLARPENQLWLAFWHSLGQRYGVEYALHGLYHRQRENPFFCSNTEFAFLSGEQVDRRIDEAIAIFRQVGWDAVGFRQPGWELNSDLSLLRVLRSRGIQYIAGSAPNAGLNAGQPLVSDSYPTLVDGLLNIPQNAELDWPLSRLEDSLNTALKMRSVFSLKAHISDISDIPNSLTRENVEKLRSFLLSIRKVHLDNVRFVTCSDVLKIAGARAQTDLSE